LTYKDGSSGRLNVTDLPIVSPVSLTTPEYSTYYYLNDQGKHTEIRFRIKAQNGFSRLFIFNVTRQVPGDTMQLNSPSPVQAIALQSPPVPLPLEYVVLRWQNSTIPGKSAWKAWSDNPAVIGPDSFNLTFPQSLDVGYMTLKLSPVGVTGTGQCTNVYVSVSDSLGRSVQSSLCVTVFSDVCSGKPTGVVSSWPALTVNTLYQTPPPYNGYPVA